MFEERERMEELEEARDIVTDLALAQRQFKYFNDKFQSRIGALPNDDLDQRPVEFILDRSSALLNGSALARAEGASKYARALSTTKEPTLQISKLEEPYPTSCQNHGQLSSQTQRYYMCRSLK